MCTIASVLGHPNISEDKATDCAQTKARSKWKKDTAVVQPGKAVIESAAQATDWITARRLSFLDYLSSRGVCAASRPQRLCNTVEIIRMFSKSINQFGFFYSKLLCC